MNYGYQRIVQYSFEEAEQKIRERLQEQGFGIITEIDVKATFKQKLNVDFKKYVILGACNPSIAYQAITEENEIGLLLPCNVTVWENEDGTVTLSAVDAPTLLGMTGRQDLSVLAEKVNRSLHAAVDAV